MPKQYPVRKLKGVFCVAETGLRGLRPHGIAGVAI